MFLKVQEMFKIKYRVMGIIAGHPTVIGHFIYLDEKLG